MKRPHRFSTIPNAIKSRAMTEFLAGKGTTKEIAVRFNFNERRLRQWFVADRRLSEFKSRTKQNIVGFGKEPKSASQRLKLSGFRSINWRGRKLEIKRGMISAVLIWKAGHPYCSSPRGGYVPLHRLVMEKHLGRYLTKNEVIHHIDMDPTNNRLSNLLLIQGHKLHGQLHSLLQLALVKLMPRLELVRLTKYLYKQALEMKTIQKRVIKKGGCGV